MRWFSHTWLHVSQTGAPLCPCRRGVRTARQLQAVGARSPEPCPADVRRRQWVVPSLRPPPRARLSLLGFDLPGLRASPPQNAAALLFFFDTTIGAQSVHCRNPHQRSMSSSSTLQRHCQGPPRPPSLRRALRVGCIFDSTSRLDAHYLRRRCQLTKSCVRCRGWTRCRRRGRSRRRGAWARRVSVSATKTFILKLSLDAETLRQRSEGSAEIIPVRAPPRSSAGPRRHRQRGHLFAC